MTVEDLIILLNTLPKSMMVYVPFDDENMLPVCATKSEIEEIETEDGQHSNAFVIRPCGCDRDDLEISTKTHPN